jgi:hypothetical protein
VCSSRGIDIYVCVCTRWQRYLTLNYGRTNPCHSIGWMGSCKPFHSAKLQGFDIRIGQPTANSMVMSVGKPLKLCGGCCACLACCRPEVESFNSEGQSLGKASQPFGGNAFTPTVEIMDRSGETYARAEGPKCIFGGLMENCTETVFKLYPKGSNKPFGAIKKVKPDGIANQMAQALTNADAYEFTLPVDLPNDQKANFISSLLLLGESSFNLDVCRLKISVICLDALRYKSRDREIER